MKKLYKNIANKSKVCSIYSLITANAKSDLEQNIVFLNQTIQQLREKESTSNKVVESLQKQLQEVLDNQERTLEDRVVYEASIRSRSRSVNSINNSLLNSYRSLAPALASQGQSPRDYLRPAVPLPETLADLVKESASNGKEEGTIKSAVKAQRQRASLVSKSSPIIQ
jgi:hypothetical protein